MKIREIISETGTSGGTTSANIASIANPNISIGAARGTKSYIGSPGKSGTKAPPQPKVKKQKPTDNALDMTNVSLFGGPAMEASIIKRW